MRRIAKTFAALLIIVSTLFCSAAPDAGGPLYGGLTAYARTGGDEYNVIAGGTCGLNAEWTLLDTGTLVISGSGMLFDWAGSGSAAWGEYCNRIITAVIGSGITSIGNSAFYGCSGMVSVTIPDSVTNIGEHAFSDCSALASVTIPDGIESICFCAFSDCSALTSVIIPETVTSIGWNAFSGCTGLTSVTVPPGCLKNVASYLFSGCTGLVSVTISDGVEKISASAFKGCTALTSITVPVSVTTIEPGAFPDCDSLSDIYYKGTEKQWRCVELGRNNNPVILASMHCEYVSIPGDVSGNGSVDNSDLARFMKFLSGERVSVAGNSCDLNGDRIFDARDLVRLMNLLAQQSAQSV